MIVYLIQHTKTGNFLPTDFYKGGTYWNGEAGKAPRIFHTKAAAQSFINHWVKGQAYIVHEHTGFYWKNVTTSLKYMDKGRKSSDIRIREASLELEPYQENLL